MHKHTYVRVCKHTHIMCTYTHIYVYVCGGCKGVRTICAQTDAAVSQLPSHGSWLCYFFRSSSPAGELKNSVNLCLENLPTNPRKTCHFAPLSAANSQQMAFASAHIRKSANTNKSNVPQTDQRKRAYLQKTHQRPPVSTQQTAKRMPC